MCECLLEKAKDEGIELEGNGVEVLKSLELLYQVM